MAGPKGVVGCFAASGESGETAKLALGMKEVPPAGYDLVGICLMADIPDEAVPGRVEAVVERQGQFDGAEIGGEMAAGLRDGFKEKCPQFCGKGFKLFYGELLEVSRIIDCWKYWIHLNLNIFVCIAETQRRGENPKHQKAFRVRTKSIYAFLCVSAPLR